MTDKILTDDDWAQSESYNTLGPAYFAARRVCDEATKSFTDEMMEPLVKDAADAFTEKLWDHIRDYLWDDTRENLQSKMWHMVDDIVKAILGGNEWAIKRYVLGERYDCENVRKQLAALIPEQLQSKTIKDLQAEVERLRKDNEWLRERYL